MRPLSILLKMVHGTQGPRWPHGDACTLQVFEEERCYNFVREMFGILGASSFVEARPQHHLKCAEQCPTIERDVSILSLLFCAFFPNFSKSTCSRKKTRWYTFSGFFPTSHSYRANAALYPLNPGSKSCRNIFETLRQLEKLHHKKFWAETK